MSGQGRSVILMVGGKVLTLMVCWQEEHLAILDLRNLCQFPDSFFCWTNEGWKPRFSWDL